MTHGEGPGIIAAGDAIVWTAGMAREKFWMFLGGGENVKGRKRRRGVGNLEVGKGGTTGALKTLWDGNRGRWK